MSLRYIFSVLALILLHLSTAAQLTANPAQVNFGTVTSQQTDSITVTLSNAYNQPFIVTDINLFHSQFTVSDTAFTIAAGGSRSVVFYVNALHNLDYRDYAIIESNSHPDGLAIPVYAHIVYSDAYYDLTQNLSNEDLKAELKVILASGYQQQTYNAARDAMFMTIDNQRVNGQGASVNTLECVYSGRTALSYTSRTDAQTNSNFDTEHTMPQSTFSSNLPMLSDLHHLFPTYSPANNARGNQPFGIVSSGVTYTDGGSKSNGTTFEPRDAQKGRSARALLYFVIRYQDYTNFVAPQEATLRTWHHTFAPNSVDTARNNDIYAVQHNRNPFVDHAEFLDRIASVCGTDSGSLEPLSWHVKALEFGSTQPGSPLTGHVHLSNQGNRHALQLSNVSLSDPAFTWTNSSSAAIASDSGFTFDIQFNPGASNQNYSATLSFNTNETGNPLVSIPLNGTSNPVSRETESDRFLHVWPNPAQNILHISQEKGSAFSYKLFDISGRSLQSGHSENGQAMLDLSTRPRGMYLLEVESPLGKSVFRVEAE